MVLQDENAIKSQNNSALGNALPNPFDVPDSDEINRYYVYRLALLNSSVIQRFTDFGIEVYCPMHTVHTQKGRRTISRQVPRTVGYLFAHTTRQKVESYGLIYDVFPVHTHRIPGQILKYEDTYVTVPDAEMATFRAIMDVTDGTIHITTPPAQQLVKGDTIRILTGPFAGIQGILISNQGSHSGTVHVHITQGLGVNIHVQDSEVAILAFSRQGNHVTTHLRSIEGEMAPILQHYSQHHTLTPQMIGWLTRHIQRYGSLTGLTHAMGARYMVHLYLAHQLLGHPQQAHELMDVYRHALVTDPRVRRSAGRTPTTAQYIQHWTALLTKS